MTTEHHLVAGSNKYQLSILNENLRVILETCPLSGKGNNIGGEIYFLTDIDIPFDGNEKDIFEIGDIVYWRFQNENKFAIAIFYGNTPHGSGRAPTSASPCVKVGSIQGDCSGLKSIISGTKIHLVKQ